MPARIPISGYHIVNLKDLTLLPLPASFIFSLLILEALPLAPGAPGLFDSIHHLHPGGFVVNRHLAAIVLVKRGIQVGDVKRIFGI